MSNLKNLQKNYEFAIVITKSVPNSEKTLNLQENNTYAI